MSLITQFVPTCVVNAISTGLQQSGILTASLSTMAKGGLVNLGASLAVQLPCTLLLPPARNVISEKILDGFEHNIGDPLISISDKIVEHLPSLSISFTKGDEPFVVNYTDTFVAALVEEVAFCGVLQTVLLTEAPKLILRNIAPEFESIVDSQVVSVARVALTSLVFALAHGGNQKGCLVPQFIEGCFYGYLREQGTSIVNLTGTHFIRNATFHSVIGLLKKLA